MNISSIFHPNNLYNTKKWKIGQTFCFENWVQNKGSLSKICKAPGMFKSRNMVSVL